MIKRIFGNWKMAQTLTETQSFLTQIKIPRSSSKDLEVAIFPSFTQLDFVKARIKQHELALFMGAQDCSTEEKGAFTGEISATMLVEAGATHVLIGHSERRQRANETNESLSKKLNQAIKAGLIPVFCIGETEAERDAKKTLQVLKHQLDPVRGGLSSAFILAYEPVWAIGTGRVPTEDEIREAHAFIYDEVPQALGILYGGSAKPENAASILRLKHVGGLLVGGASLKAESFQKILETPH